MDARGRVTFMNEAAIQLTTARDGLFVDMGELRAARDSDTARLRTLVAGATVTAGGHGFDSGGTLALGRPSGRRPLVALVAPSPRKESPFSIEPAAAIVLVADPEREDAPAEAVLGELFRLTPAEARLTNLLVRGSRSTKLPITWACVRPQFECA